MTTEILTLKKHNLQTNNRNVPSNLNKCACPRSVLNITVKNAWIYIMHSSTLQRSMDFHFFVCSISP